MLLLGSVSGVAAICCAIRQHDQRNFRSVATVATDRYNYTTLQPPSNNCRVYLPLLASQHNLTQHRNFDGSCCSCPALRLAAVAWIREGANCRANGPDSVHFLAALRPHAQPHRRPFGIQLLSADDDHRNTSLTYNKTLRL